MKILSIRENPDAVDEFTDCFVRWWGGEETVALYRDCIAHAVRAEAGLPQWYLLKDAEGRVLGGAGLITNDFISRMDLWPWLCALYVEPEQRGRGHGALLVRHVCAEAARLGFGKLYLSTDHEGYYERLGFAYLGRGWHPWGASSRIYEISVPVPVK